MLVLMAPQFFNRTGLAQDNLPTAHNTIIINQGSLAAGK